MVSGLPACSEVPPVRPVRRTKTHQDAPKRAECTPDWPTEWPALPSGIPRPRAVRSYSRSILMTFQHYVDQDSTDAFLDGPQPLYAGGQTIWKRLEVQGYDVSPAA
jgi:hypothetical protein